MLPQRPLGTTGITASVLAFGGIVARGRPREDIDRDLRGALEVGLNYVDIAPSYGDSEERLGPVLAPVRDRVTLACKTTQRTAAGSRRELEQSLQRLHTEHLDIYQMHALSKDEDVDTALAEGGAIETFLGAREEGKVRLLGFSAHSERAALRAIESGHFDTVLFPFNFTCWEVGHFGPEVLAAANARGMGILALKAMARTKVPEGEAAPYSQCWYVPEDRPELATLLLRWTLARPGLTLAVPPGAPELFRLALQAPGLDRPPDDGEIEHLRAALGGYAPIFRAPAAPAP